MTIINQIEQFLNLIVLRHKYWYEHLCKFCDFFEYNKPKIPDLLIYQKPARKNSNKHLFGAYYASDKSVHINLLTALSCEWSEVDNTIGHEMCHAFQNAINYQILNNSRKDYIAETKFAHHDAVFHLLMRHCRLAILIEKFDEMKAKRWYDTFRALKIDEVFYKTKNGTPQVHIFNVKGLNE